MNIASIYCHVDNGGISVEVLENEGNVEIKFTTSYFAYPDITSTLNLRQKSNSGFLKDLGLMFIEASNTLKREEENVSITRNV